jgi:hypothetical protein
MPPNSFEGVFYVRHSPVIRYEDGLFFIRYDMGNVHAEFVMQPSVYQKAIKEVERAFKQFQDGKASVTPMRRRKKAEPGH